MQFLIITRQRTPPPPEMTLPLLGAMQAWMAQHRASGKIKSSWAFAGMPGGGGVIEVDSAEELDEIMAGFPLGPFSSIEVLALSDFDRNIEAVKVAFGRMMEMMGGPR